MKTMKTCAICEETKSVKEFRKKKTSIDGFSRSCDVCTRGDVLSPRLNREYLLSSKYGISQAVYEEMLEAQGGVCAICGTKEPKGMHDVFHVDHNHKTGEVRALLCNNCNLGIGHLKDSPTVLRKAAEYLDKHGNYCSHTTTHPEEG